MASRELVGRPLVPFFDADDNVNDALTADASRSFESLDVDARVWNRELGYFEYPNEQAGSSSSDDTLSATRPTPASTPIAIQQSPRVLLTPAMMLSSSCPDVTPLANELLQQVAEESATTRSASAKRASKQDKSRSNTPARRRTKNSKQESHATAAAAVVAAVVVEEVQTANGKEGKAAGRRGGRNKSKESSKHQLQASSSAPAGSAKWAWSAFQSSPDPKQLPLPPFLLLSPGSANAAGGALPLPPHSRESGQPTEAQNASAELLPDRPPQPTTPPEAEAQPMSIELSMTQDLRRMLNIGGG